MFRCQRYRRRHASLGPLLLTYGPLAGLSLGHDASTRWACDEPRHLPIGVAPPLGQVVDRKGPNVNFQLVLDKITLEER